MTALISKYRFRDATFRPLDNGRLRGGGRRASPDVVPIRTVPPLRKDCPAYDNGFNYILPPPPVGEGWGGGENVYWLATPILTCPHQGRRNSANAKLAQFFLGALICAVWFLFPESAHADAMSVIEFNEKVGKWKSEQTDPSPRTYTVEGRIMGHSPDRVRLKNCPDVLFLSKTKLPELSRKSSNIEMSGKVHFDKKTGEFTFMVESAREVQSDVERFHELRRKLRQAPPEKWYELGKWAQVRGDFYKDHELSKLSDEAYAGGFELERKELARGNPKGLLELAEKAKLFGIKQALRQEMAHEAYYLLWSRSDKLPVAGLEDLAKQMKDDLPGCNEPLRFMPTELIKKYRKAPLETYAAADVETRKQIHCYLYSDLLLRTITPRLAADGSNGFEIASQIDRLGDAHHALAEEYRDKALAAKASEVETLTKSQVVDLAEQYRARQKSKEADQLIESWLTRRLRALEPDDTEGLLELSEEYRRMLNRRELADRMLIDGWKRNPKATDIKERLENEGYHLDGGNWLSAAEFNNRPEGKLEKAIRAGRVELGMTTSHVRRSLGEPVSISRAVTSGQVTELWKYGLTDRTHLVVRLVKRGSQSEFTVVDVDQRKSQ
jgi:hypothetical protein